MGYQELVERVERLETVMLDREPNQATGLDAELADRLAALEVRVDDLKKRFEALKRLETFRGKARQGEDPVVT